MPVILDKTMTYKFDESDAEFDGVALQELMEKHHKLTKESKYYYLVSNSRDYDSHSIATSIFMRTNVDWHKLPRMKLHDLIQQFILEVIEEEADDKEISDFRLSFEHNAIVVKYQYWGYVAELRLFKVDSLPNKFQDINVSSTGIKASLYFGYSGTN